MLRQALLEYIEVAVQAKSRQTSGEMVSCSGSADDGAVSTVLDLGSEFGRDPVEFEVRVVGLAEDSLWYALALELNLLGYGESFDEALEDLEGAIDAQVCYAAIHNSLDGIAWRASQRYFDLYRSGAEETPRRKLRVALRKSRSIEQRTMEESDDETDIVSKITDITWEI